MRGLIQVKALGCGPREPGSNPGHPMKGVSMYTNEDLKEMMDQEGINGIIGSIYDSKEIIDPYIRVLFEQMIRIEEEIKERLDCVVT